MELCMRFTIGIRLIACVLMGIIWSLGNSSALMGEEIMKFGFARRVITPDEPMRLSGYANRTKPATATDEQLRVRAMVLETSPGQRSALVSVDLLGLSAEHHREIARKVLDQYQIPRERLAVGCTHTHTGPRIATASVSLLIEPFTPQELERAIAYSNRVIDEVVAVIGEAIADLQPGKLYLGEGNVGFAVNRRMLKEGKWTGFGVNPAGPVDHSLPILKVTDPQGKIRGLIFNYACHPTTLGPEDNRYSPDWPGYAALALEEVYPGSTVVSLTGCGGDANPEPRTTGGDDNSRLAIGHGRSLAAEAKKVLDAPMEEITALPTFHYGTADLKFDLPAKSELDQRLKHSDPVTRLHAQNMLKIIAEKGQLPATYPLPLQTWQFGDQLTLIFMGGEVVVEYALRLKQAWKPGYVWVTAYTNDVPGYVASEKIRAEGGYETDYSMIFYNQPGRWASGTEDFIIERIGEISGHSLSKTGQ